MEGHVFSPDGRFMWTGSEWIPAPPTSDQSAHITLQDSVVAGDVHINQNSAEDITAAMVNALETLGFSGNSSPAELTPDQEDVVDQVLAMSEQLTKQGIEIDSQTEITLNNAVNLAGSADERFQFWQALIEKGQQNDAFYLGFKPRKSGAIQQNVGKPGVFFCFRKRSKHSEVTLTIENIGFDRSMNYFGQLELHRKAVERLISTPIVWQPASERTSSSRIIAKIDAHDTSLDLHFERLIMTMRQFREAFNPLIEQLSDLT